MARAADDDRAPIIEEQIVRIAARRSGKCDLPFGIERGDRGGQAIRR